MFRDNEASRVGDVLAAKLAGDVRGIIDAAIKLWVSSPERPHEHDAAVAEAWAAIAAADAVAPAIDAGLGLLRERQPFRSSAFVDLVEHVDDPRRLLAIADEVLAAGWDLHTYLGAVFIRLVEAGHGLMLWDYIRRNRKRLASDAASWLLVGYVLTTTWIGNRHDVDKWFRRWEERAGVPMWIIAAYASTVAQLPHNQLRKLVAISRLACERATPDLTEGYFALYLMIDDLRSGRDDAFVARMQRHPELLSRHASCPLLLHPLVRYANAVKHRHPVTMNDWSQRLPRSINWRILDMIADIHRLFVKTARTLPLFDRMLALPPGAGEALSLHIEMTSARLQEIPWLEPPWKRLLAIRG